ncbi:MAG: DUF2188 domain-containing protein [Caulobacterales bacterium]
MTEAHYHIVPHDGGWTYKVGDVFGATYSSEAQARDAAERAAAEQRVAPEQHDVEYEDENGRWRTEISGGAPDTEVD